MESYMSAGDFTPGHKMLSAIKEYAIINSIYAAIGISFLIYIAVRNNLDMCVPLACDLWMTGWWEGRGVAVDLRESIG
jgi:hypothetical protein